MNCPDRSHLSARAPGVRPLGEVLRTLAAELAALSEIGIALDDHLDELASGAPAPPDKGILQQADRLRQFLEDLTRVAALAAEAPPPEITIETGALDEAVHLADLRSRLRGSAPDLVPKSGEVDLF